MVTVGASPRRPGNMPTTPKVEAKLQPGGKAPVQVIESLSRGDKINFINDCFRRRSEYLATVTNSEKITKKKEAQFWLDRRAASTCPFQEGTYTTASKIKRIVTETCTKRRRESIPASSRLPVVANHADLQHAMDLWIPIWKLWDTLSLMAKTQALVLQVLGQAEVEHHTGKQLGPADGPFTPIIFSPVVQEAVDKHVESLKRPWEGTPGEAMYPAEVELWSSQVSTEVDSGDATTDDSDEDEDAITSVEETPPPPTSPRTHAKLKLFEAAFITQHSQGSEKANAAAGYVSPPSTIPGDPRGSNSSSRSSKHSVMESPVHQDAPGAIRLRPCAEVNANAEASDPRDKGSSKEPDGEPSPLRTLGFEERRSANIALIEKATGVTMSLAAKPPPKPIQHKASKSQPRSDASPPEKTHITRARSRVGRGQDTSTSELPQEKTHAAQRPESKKIPTVPKPSSTSAASSGEPAPVSVLANSQTSTITTNNARSAPPVRLTLEIPKTPSTASTDESKRMGHGKGGILAARGRSLATAPAPPERTTNHVIHTGTARPPTRDLHGTRDWAKEGLVTVNSSLVQPYFKRPLTPSPFRPHIREGYWQVHAAGNGKPARPYWHQQRWEYKGSLVSHPPRREGTARIVNAPGGDREVATVTGGPRGFHTYFDENGEPNSRGLSGKPMNRGSFHRTPSRPRTDGMRHPDTRGSDMSPRNARSAGGNRTPVRRDSSHSFREYHQGVGTATPGSVAGSNASSGLFVKTPKANQWSRHATPPFKSEDPTDSAASEPGHYNTAEDRFHLFPPEANAKADDTAMTGRVEAELTPAQLGKLRRKEMMARRRAGEKPPRPCDCCGQDHWAQTCPARKAEKKAERKKRKAAKLAETQRVTPPQAPAAPQIKAGKRKADELEGSDTTAEKGAGSPSVQPTKRAKHGPHITEQPSPARYRGHPSQINRSPLKSNFTMGRYQPSRWPTRQAQTPSQLSAAPGPSYYRSASVATEWVKDCSPETQAELLSLKYKKAKQQIQSNRVQIANFKEEVKRLRRWDAAEPRDRGGQN